MAFVSTFDHTNPMTDNIIDRDELQDNLINQILDDMDIKTMMAILYDNMSESCLLYTSPSPRDRTRSRMPSSA